MIDGFYDVRVTMWTEGGGGSFDVVEGLVEGDVSGSELDEETGLVMTELGDGIEEVVGA